MRTADGVHASLQVIGSRVERLQLPACQKNNCAGLRVAPDIKIELMIKVAAPTVSVAT
jgi:hypothetical protein